MEDVQARLKQARINAGMTQVEMARRLEVTQQAYQKIESGKTPDIRISTLTRLCKILNITPNWLLGFEN